MPPTWEAQPEPRPSFDVMPGLPAHTAFIAFVALWAGGARRVGAQIAGLGSNNELVDCSCDCCHVVYRQPTEIADPEKDSNVKCATRDKTEEGAECPTECGLGINAKVLQMGKTGTAQYSQFCYRECKPYDVVPGVECWDISYEEAKEAKTEDKNGKDVNYVPVVLMKPTDAPPGGKPLEIPTVVEDVMVIKPAPPPPSKAEAIVADAAKAKHTSSEAMHKLDGAAAEAEKAAKAAEKHAKAAREHVEGWNKKDPLPTFMQLATSAKRHGLLALLARA